VDGDRGMRGWIQSLRGWMGMGTKVRPRARSLVTTIGGHLVSVNPLMGTLKPHSNGPLHSNTLIGTLAVDGWAVTFVQRGGACVACGLEKGAGVFHTVLTPPPAFCRVMLCTSAA